MDCPRRKILKMIMSKSALSEVYAKDMEIGVYNWAIQHANTQRIARNWKNPRFLKLYVEKARSIIDNLNPQSYISNTSLQDRVMKLECLPHEVAFLSADQIHPEAWNDSIERFLKKYENAYENTSEAMTEMFTCSKCKNNKCSFYEKQIRSGDEGMTLFIRCLVCDNKWRQN